MKHTIFDTPILNGIMRLVSIVFLRMIGWRPDGGRPEPDKYVLIAAPHTSNWDFPIMMAYAFYYRLKIQWMGKDSLFPWFLRPLIHYIGGISVDRSAATGLVEQTIQQFREHDRLAIAIPPEGTRGKGEYWKSGFYHVAHGAGVPVVLGFVDYARKVGGFGPAITLTGDKEADMVAIREFYADIGAKFPDKKCAIRLPD